MVKTLVTFISIALSLHLLGSIEAHTDAAAHNGKLGQQHHRSLLLRGLVLSGERKTTDTEQDLQLDTTPARAAYFAAGDCDGCV
jgi:hypothetical protein